MPGKNEPALLTPLYDAQMRLYPEAAGGHLIRELLARADTPLDRLLTLAEQNASIRPNGEAKLLLAKAYFQGRPDDGRAADRR